MGKPSYPVPPTPEKTVEEAAEACGLYAVEAFYFVQKGLQVTAIKIHTDTPDGEGKHVSGQQLAKGLRDVAIDRWGLLARTVLASWGVYSTLDFGRIVYAMIDAGLFGRSDTDRLTDFKDVYDFRTAFSEQKYRIAPAVTA